jgi:hypothetical protein
LAMILTAPETKGINMNKADALSDLAADAAA